MIALFLAALLAPAQQGLVESVTIRERECYAMVQEGEQVVSVRVPGLYVIGQTARDGPFAVNVPQGASIACPRSSIVPAPNDWKVLVAGYPLYIMETGAPPESRRVGALELSQGQFRYRLVRGQLTAPEAERAGIRLDQLQRSSRQ